MNFDTVVLVIIGTVVGGLILWILLFPLRQLMTKRTEKKREQDRKLYEHFRDIKQEVIQIVDSCMKLRDYYGMIILNNAGLTIDWNDYISKFGIGLLPQPSNIFSAHFSKDAAELAEWRKQIEEHNKKRVKLDYEIKNDFQSKSIPVININSYSNRSFYVYDTIFRPLFIWWQACNLNKATHWPNFNSIGTKADGGPNNLYADGWSSQAIAHAKTDNAKKRCISAIRKVAKSVEYQQEVSYLTISIGIIQSNVKKIGNHLQSKINDVDKYWPGTSNYKFKKVKNCQRCREIFSQ